MFVSSCVKFNPRILKLANKVFETIVLIKQLFTSTVNNVKLTCVT